MNPSNRSASSKKFTYFCEAFSFCYYSL